MAALLLLSACGSGGAAASCVAPQLVALTPDHGPTGTSVTMRVEWLRDGCNDYTGADEERPRKNVPVYFSQRDRTLVGRMTGAGKHYEGSLTFVVPPAARPGTAGIQLAADQKPIATFTVAPP